MPATLQPDTLSIFGFPNVHHIFTENSDYCISTQGGRESERESEREGEREEPLYLKKGNY